MTTLQLGYGKTTQSVAIPDENVSGILWPNEKQLPELIEEEIIKNAIRNPIGTVSLRETVRPGEHIAIVTSDITRPLPSDTVLPPLLEELGSIGVKDRDITIVFALGSHRMHTEEEKTALVGRAVYERIRCIDGDCTDVVHMGTTAAGTPVDIAREVAEADRRICLGNIEYHYFAGYSGGAKAIMPGVSTRSAIQSNHSLMVRAGAKTGNLDCNPVRMDLEEAIRYCPIDFIINVVLDNRKKIVYAAAGDYIAAHRDGCRFLDSLYGKAIEKRADIVIASQGGVPKDINLYQAQKALDNAGHAVREGGVIILAGACGEGMGEATFEQWMKNAPTPDSLIERIERDFQLGGHKAAAIALILKKADVYLVSDMQPAFVRDIFMHPYPSVQEALESAFAKLGRDASVLVMPFAGSTLPIVKEV